MVIIYMEVSCALFFNVLTIYACVYVCFSSLVISDGTEYSQVMLATQMNYVVQSNSLKKYSIVRVEDYAVNHVKNNKLVLNSHCFMPPYLLFYIHTYLITGSLLLGVERLSLLHLDRKGPSMIHPSDFLKFATIFMRSPCLAVQRPYREHRHPILLHSHHNFLIIFRLVVIVNLTVVTQDYPNQIGDPSAYNSNSKPAVPMQNHQQQGSGYGNSSYQQPQYGQAPATAGKASTTGFHHQLPSPSSFL